MAEEQGIATRAAELERQKVQAHATRHRTTEQFKGDNRVIVGRSWPREHAI